MSPTSEKILHKLKSILSTVDEDFNGRSSSGEKFTFYIFGDEKLQLGVNFIGSMQYSYQPKPPEWKYEFAVGLQADCKESGLTFMIKPVRETKESGLTELYTKDVFPKKTEVPSCSEFIIGFNLTAHAGNIQMHSEILTLEDVKELLLFAKSQQKMSNTKKTKRIQKESIEAFESFLK
ncbi:MAG: hypothetical protein AABY15_03050 [Nanoarchaeota archaeon]